MCVPLGVVMCGCDRVSGVALRPVLFMCVLCSHRVTTPVMVLVIDFSFSRLVWFRFAAVSSIDGPVLPFRCISFTLQECGRSVMSSVPAHLSINMFLCCFLLPNLSSIVVAKQRSIHWFEKLFPSCPECFCVTRLATY